MRRIKAVLQKEIRQLLRDKRTLAMIICMPLVQLLLYGYGIDTDVKHIATVVHDEDRTPLSRRLVAAFVQSAYFDVGERVPSMRAARRRLDRGQAKVCLHIPVHFARDLLAGRQTALQLLVDGTDSNPANTAMNTGQAIVAAFVQQERLVPISVAPIDYRPRLWYNPDLKSAYFMIPGLVGLLIQLLIPMITASAVVREKEAGNFEQLLVTPIRPYEYIIGKLIPYLGIGLLIAVAILATAHVLFHVPVRGNFITLCGLTLLFVTIALGIGLFASTVANTQQQATQIVMLFMPPSILLSGFIFPRETMPWFVHWLSYAIPLTYYLQIVRGIVLKGLGMIDLWEAIAALIAMAILVVALSIRNFHKRLN
ncbi:MAG: ABC transporter permease [Deltaproteobacteria bacterium]|nr:ABC transporter permease [Deltaproteobacteria bacterium]